MLPVENIQTYGGKAAILMYVNEKLPHLPIRPFVVKEHGECANSVLSDFDLMQKPVIARSSSPHEYGDFEGIFESVQDIENSSYLEMAIARIERSAVSERAKEYAKQNGFKVDEKIHILIQEQSNSVYNGAMMRHPNNPDLIFISYFSSRAESGRSHHRFLFDCVSESEKYNRCYHTDGISEDDAKFLVGVYKEIESLNEIAAEHSLFVEFGFEPFSLYQVRPFKKIQTADFPVPKISRDVGLWTDLCFGITPPEGLVFPVGRGIGTDEALNMLPEMINNTGPLKLEGIEIILKTSLRNAAYANYHTGIDVNGAYLADLLRQHNTLLDRTASNPYCFMTSSAHREDYDVDLSIPKVGAVVLGHPENFLVHNLIRLFKKASITAAFPVLFFEPIYHNIKSLEDKVRIFSNGKEAVVIKES